MNMYDLKKDSEIADTKNNVKRGIPGPTLNLDTDQIPELEDYNIGDTIELHVITKVRGINRPEMLTTEDKSEQNKDEKVDVKLEIVSAGIMNMKKTRKEAEERGLDKKDWDEIQSKRIRKG